MNFETEITAIVKGIMFVFGLLVGNDVSYRWIETAYSSLYFSFILLRCSEH